jgi:hypothetical protein
MATLKTPIRYTSRDFGSIKEDLVQYAKRYYPETYRDFNEASFGSLMLDTVAYVGDILSFYVDYQVNESFLDTAAETSNIVKLSKQLGFKYRGAPAATGVAAFYAIIPANEVGLGPDSRAYPILKAGTSVSAKNGSRYTLVEDARFDDPGNDVVVARVNDSTGVPTSYAVKAFGKIVAGSSRRERIIVGGFKQFLKVPLASRKISEIVSVVDDEGHEYFEVDYLSQNVIYRPISNRGTDRETVPSVMKPYAVPRRFTLERIDGRYYLQFGYGSDSELNTSSVAEPTSITLKMHAKEFINDTTFDPSKLLDTDKFGVAPANTTLSVAYRENTVANSNASIGSISKMVSTIIDFNDPTVISNSTMADIRNSIEVYNEEQIVGSLATPSNQELRRRAFDFFAAQNRAVTLQDFEAIAYGMPPRFGAIKRIRVVQDPDSFKRNINMYVLAQNENGFLTLANNTLKENLKMWLNNYKMIHDTIDILDGKTVNFGVEFHVIANPEFNKAQVLAEAQRAVARIYTEPLFMGEPIYITDVYNILNKEVRGVIDVKSAKIFSRVSGAYSDASFDFNLQMSADGRVLSAPDNVCFELKYANIDIKGTIE